MAHLSYGITPDRPRDSVVLDCKGLDLPNKLRPTGKYGVRVAAGTYLVHHICCSVVVVIEVVVATVML